MLDRSDGVRVVTIRGTIDIIHALAFTRDAGDRLPDASRSMLLGFEAVSSLDSGGVSAIVKLVRQLRAQSIDTRASIGTDSMLSSTIVELLRQIVPIDDADA